MAPCETRRDAAKGQLIEALVLPDRVLLGHDGKERALSSTPRGYKSKECVLSEFTCAECQ